MGSFFKRTWPSRDPTGRRIHRVAWGYRLQVNGKRERQYSAEWRARDDARQALARRLIELEAPQPPEPPPPKTFAGVAEEYLALKRAKGKRSIHDDELILTRLKTWFGDATPIVDITAQRIAQYERDRLSKMSARGTPLAAATLNREVALVRHMLRLAEEWGYLQKVPRIRLGKEPEGRLRFLTEDEITRLLGAAAESQNTYFLPIVTIALNTGMRKNEILKLAWERVDFSRGVLQLAETKNGRRREVPMNRAVYDVLSSLPGAKEEGPVFRRRDGAAWGDVRTAFEQACKRAKITVFRFHDLRHTCASWLIMRGRSLKKVQEILSHREFSMTIRYAHLSPDRLREAVAALEDFRNDLAHKKAHGGKLDPAPLASPRKAGVAQRQSN
jgi:integrase